MSVKVKLPRTVSGKDLSDAIEEAGKKLGWYTDRSREVYYVSGSVKQEEIQSALTIRKPKVVEIGDKYIPRSFLDKIKGNPKNMKTETAPSHTHFSITVPAEQKFDSTEFGTYVEVQRYRRRYVYDSRFNLYTCYGSESVKTNEKGFQEIKDDFEQFLTYLFEILEQEPATA